MTTHRTKSVAGDGEGGATRIQAVDRAVALLKHVLTSREPQSVSELVDATGLNRSTAWRLLMTLEHHGLIDREQMSNRYGTGYELLRLVNIRPVHESLANWAAPIIDTLADETSETVNLSVPVPDGIHTIAQRQAATVASVNLAGVHLPLHATASGKVRLAYASAEERTTLLGRKLKRYTSRTITSLDALDRELASVRDRGYALERDEFEDGVSSVSAPVIDSQGRAMAFVSVWSLSARLPPDRLEAISEPVRVAALRIAQLDQS